MGFTVYEKGSAPVSTVPTLTIQKRGLLSMNRAAYEMMDSPDAVELLWDADRRVIGLRSAPVDGPNSYPVRAQSADSSKGPLLIAGSLFTRFIGLDTSEAKRWVPQMEQGVLCVDLNKPHQRAASNRSKRKTATEQGDGAGGTAPAG